MKSIMICSLDNYYDAKSRRPKFATHVIHISGFEVPIQNSGQKTWVR